MNYISCIIERLFFDDEDAEVLPNAQLYFRCRKESSFNLGSAETKLLYTLHWILLDAADECALAMGNEGKLDSTPFAYLFPITAITVRTEQKTQKPRFIPALKKHTRFIYNLCK